MRPNHQNKRMRGRSRGGTGGNGGGGGGKGPNPLTRSYESNGPDVKIRGTAQHIAEKYLQMGRDAQATGDYVTAENYFQHGEHYLRIIATAHEAMRLANPQFRPYEPQDGEDGDEDEDGVPFAPGTPQPEIRYTNAPQPDSEQPDFQPQPREYRERPQQERSPRFEPRQDRRDDRRDDRRRDHQPRDGQPRDSQPRDSHPITRSVYVYSRKEQGLRYRYQGIECVICHRFSADDWESKNTVFALDIRPICASKYA